MNCRALWVGVLQSSMNCVCSTDCRKLSRITSVHHYGKHCLGEIVNIGFIGVRRLFDIRMFEENFIAFLVATTNFKFSEKALDSCRKQCERRSRRVIRIEVSLVDLEKVAFGFSGQLSSTSKSYSVNFFLVPVAATPKFWAKILCLNSGGKRARFSIYVSWCMIQLFLEFV